MQTLRVAARTLLQRPGLTLLVVVTLALGLGANAAIFGIIDALVLRPFPAAETEGIVMLTETAPGENYRQESVAPADFLDWKRQTDVFAHLSAFEWWDVNLVGRDAPERVQGHYVSADFFSTLGVQPALGRAFTADEETFGRHRRVVLSHELWRRRFGGDPAVVGRPVLVDGTPHEVVGVAPEGFTFPIGSQIWAPLAFDPAEPPSRTARYLTVVARLAPGRTLEEAQAQMTVVADRLARVDGRLLAFIAVLALATAVGSALLPALQASRPRLAETLKEGGRAATVGRGRLRLRQALVVAEMGLALPLLVAAGLGVLGIHRFLNGPQGYDPDNLLVMRMVLSDPRYEENDPARRQLVERVLARVAALPGVERAAAVNVLPAAGGNSSPPFEIEGQPPADPANPPTVDSRLVTPDYFATLRLPIVEGRGLTAADREDAAPVALVSRALAALYFPDGGAIGRRLRVGEDEDWPTVVGVTGDHIHDWFGRRNHPTVFRPYAQAPSRSLGLAVRTRRDPAALAGDVRAALRGVDPAQPVFDLMPMRVLLKERTVGLQYIAAIMGVFAGLALLLATVGVYAVMAYLVSQRTHEIGVRMALGATRGDVERLAVWQAARLTALGALVGLVLSVALGRLMEAGMLGVVSNDPRLLAGLAAVLVTASLAAAYVPARRAAALDPLDALRVE